MPSETWTAIPRVATTTGRYARFVSRSPVRPEVRCDTRTGRARPNRGRVAIDEPDHPSWIGCSRPTRRAERPDESGFPRTSGSASWRRPGQGIQGDQALRRLPSLLARGFPRQRAASTADGAAARGATGHQPPGPADQVGDRDRDRNESGNVLPSPRRHRCPPSSRECPGSPRGFSGRRNQRTDLVRRQGAEVGQNRSCTRS